MAISSLKIIMTSSVKQSLAKTVRCALAVYTCRELAPSRRMKRVSLTTVCEWVLSAWAALSREITMRSFAKCGISLEVDLAWNSSGDDGDASSNTHGDQSSSD